MQRLLLLLCSIALLLTCSVAEAKKYVPVPPYAPVECKWGTNVAIKFSGFYPLSSKVRGVYNPVLPDFTLEVSQWALDDWLVWMCVDYIFMNGHSHSLHERTTLSMVPVSIGTSYVFRCTNRLSYYIGAGIVYSYVKIRDHSDYVHQESKKGNVGAIVRSGCVYRWNARIFFETFFDYLYQTFHFPKTENHPFVTRSDLDMSGVRLGVGVGIAF